METENEDLFDTIRNLGITPSQLQKRYPLHNGEINWEAVEKDKKHLSLIFPDIRDQILEINEILEKTKNRIYDLEDRLEELEKNTSEVIGLGTSLYEVRGQATTAQNMSFIATIVIFAALSVFVYAAYFQSW